MATDQAQEPKQIYVTISAMEAMMARMEERQEQFLQRINERFDRLEARWNRQQQPDKTPLPPIPVVQAQPDKTQPQEVEQPVSPPTITPESPPPTTPPATVQSTSARSFIPPSASSSATSQTPAIIPTDKRRQWDKSGQGKSGHGQGLGVPYIRVATWRLRYSPGRRRRRKKEHNGRKLVQNIDVQTVHTTIEQTI